MGKLDSVRFLGKSTRRIAAFTDSGGIGYEFRTVIGDDGDIAIYLMLFVVRRLVVGGMDDYGRQVSQLRQMAVIAGSGYTAELQRLNLILAFELRFEITHVPEPARALDGRVVHLVGLRRTVMHIQRDSVHEIRTVGSLEET